MIQSKNQFKINTAKYSPPNRALQENDLSSRKEELTSRKSKNRNGKQNTC